MSSFLEYEHSYNNDQNLGSGNISHSEDLNQKHFRGPSRFTCKIDPLDEGDYTVKPPTVGSYHIDNLVASPLPLRKSQLIQFSPADSVQEGNDLIVTSKLDEPKETKDDQVNNFIKLVIAKSYFNRFVANMLQRAYVRKPQHFTQFQNTMMDDLRYIDQQHKSKKHWLSKICRRFKLFPILDQSSYLVIGWQILHILTIITVFFWTPFNISFGITYDQVVFNGVTVRNVENYFLITIIVDAIVVLNTTYIEKGVIIKSRRKIFTNYLNTQAIYDLVRVYLISFLLYPFWWHCNLKQIHQRSNWDGNCVHMRYIIVVDYLNYNLECINWKSITWIYIRFFNFPGSSQDFIELIKLLFMVVFIGHLFACLWHGVAFYQQGNRETWIDVYASELGMFSTYNCSLYWAVQTMITVGYGDLTPTNDLERLCANLSMFVACGVYAFSFNFIGLMLSNLNSRQILYKRSINLLNSYLIKNQIKIELQSRIRNYYDYIFQEEQEINDEEVSQITTKLSSSLQEELNFEVRFNVMKTNKVLTKFSQKTLKQLSLQIEEVRFSPEDQILVQNTIDDASLYIITKGTICIQFQDTEQRNTRILSYLSKGQCFGEYSFFTGMCRTASAKSVGFSRAYKISRQQLLNILSVTPLDLERYCEVRDSILLSNNFQPAKLSCYSCQRFDHLIKDCPIIHYVADNERVLKKEFFPITQTRNKNYTRNSLIRKKFDTLKECKKTMVLIRDFQTRQVLDNVTIMDDDLDGSYDEPDISPQEYCMIYIQVASMSKSLSKISRQQSQNRSYSQDNHLQPIQESDSSVDSPTPNKQRQKQVKQTIQTAGFGVSESLHQKLASIQENETEDKQERTSITNLQKVEDHKFSIKNDSLGLPSPNDIVRGQGKRVTLVRKQKKEDSYQPVPSQTQVDVRERNGSIQNQIKKNKFKDIREQSQELPIYPSVQSVDKRDQLRRRTTKTNRSKTARTLKTMKIQDNHTQNQELSMPLIEAQTFSMELEDFEVLKNYQYYFSWNNSKVVVARAQRIFKMYLEKKRNFGNQFSLYTFSNIAMNKALRIKRRLKLLDEPQFEATNVKKPHTLGKSPKQGRAGNKRNTTATDQVIGFHSRKPGFGTQIQASPFHVVQSFEHK